MYSPQVLHRLFNHDEHALRGDEKLRHTLRMVPSDGLPAVSFWDLSAGESMQDRSPGESTCLTLDVVINKRT